MNLNIVRKPILSEKAYKQMEKGIYVFQVSKNSSKKQIASEIKKQFNVEVVKVNVLKTAPKSKRIAKTRKQAQVGGGKKAMVYLAKGQNIAVLSPKTDKEKSTKNKGPKEKDVQKVSVEGKEG